jgi:hypothetical protein
LSDFKAKNDAIGYGLSFHDLLLKAFYQLALGPDVFCPGQIPVLVLFIQLPHVHHIPAVLGLGYIQIFRFTPDMRRAGRDNLHKRLYTAFLSFFLAKNMRRNAKT